MTVVLFDKKAETHVFIDNVAILEKETELIGWNGKKFRYMWRLVIKESAYEKTFPCNRYEIHTILNKG